MKAKRVAAAAPAMKAMKAKRVAAPAMKAMKAKRGAAPAMKAMKAKRVAAAAPAMKAMKAKRVAAAPAMKAMKAKVVGGCAGGGCVVHACQSTSLLVTGRRCSLGAAGPGHPPSRSRGCSSEGSCCTQRFGISCECGGKTAKKK